MRPDPTARLWHGSPPNKDVKVEQPKHSRLPFGFSRCYQVRLHTAPERRVRDVQHEDWRRL